MPLRHETPDQPNELIDLALARGTADVETLTRIVDDVFGTVGPPTQPSTRLLNLLQEAFDAGEDPDLTFDDFIRYALQGKMLTIEVL